MIKPNPQITVVVVFRNEENNLKALIDSFDRYINEEQMQAFDFLFVDNCSTDKSVEFLQSQTGKALPQSTKIIERKENHMAQARQQALENGITPWVLFLDGDTLIQDNWAKNALRSIADASDKEWVIGGGENVFGNEPPFVFILECWMLDSRGDSQE